MTACYPPTACSPCFHRVSIASKVLRALAAASISVGFSLVAHASIIYSDLGSGGSFDSSSGLTIGTPSFGLSQAAEFSNLAGTDMAITQIDLGLIHNLGTNSAIVSLWSASGSTLGSQLGSWTVSNQPDGSTAAPALTTINDITGVTLLAGTNYFLKVAPGAGDTLDIWGNNTVGATALIATISQSGTRTAAGVAPAFQVQGNAIPAVPVPASLWLLFSGLTSLGLLRGFAERHGPRQKLG